MQRPDFALAASPALAPADLLFIFEHFPVAGVDAVEAVQRLHANPQLLESLLEANFLRDALLHAPSLASGITPALYFNVMLRHHLPGPRDASERRAIHYLAHLLGVFTHSERLHRIQHGDQTEHHYLVDLVQESATADHDRRFLVDAHIGNYAMFVSGLQAHWVQHRLRHARRLQSLEYYRQIGRSYFLSAARHPQAATLGLSAVFRHLAQRFEHFRAGLQLMSDHWLRPIGEQA